MAHGETGLLIQEPCKASVGEEFAKAPGSGGCFVPSVGTVAPGHIPPKERGEGFAVSLGTVQTWSGPGKAGEWLPALPKLLPTTEGTRTRGHASGTSALRSKRELNP